MTALGVLHELFEPALAAAQDMAEQGAEKPNKSGMIGAFAIDTARNIWLRQEGASAPPKELKDTSDIYEFLAALFDALSIEGTVRSAYSAWGRLYVNE